MIRSPLTLSVTVVMYWTTIQNFNLSLRRNHRKFSYERRAYESVDDKILSWAISQMAMKMELGDWKG